VTFASAAGDKVVVLTTRELGGVSTEGADVLTFNDDRKLVTFEALAIRRRPAGCSRTSGDPARSLRTSSPLCAV
jgi:hypothetical protein